MKTAFIKLCSAVILLFTSTILFAQRESIYMMKNGSVVFQSTVSEIDSIVFETRSESQKSNFTESLNGTDLDMVYVQGGAFKMGCSESDNNCETTELPAHNVTLSDYYVSKYEVTNAQWEAVMNDGTSKDNKPKTTITWYDAVTFTCKLSELTGKKYRLATEAEFEFAARGGVKSKGYLYSGSNNADDVAWNSSNVPEQCFGYGDSKTCYPGGAQEVGTKAPNELGIYDMSGNVYEWMYDNWGKFDESGADVTNPVTIHKHTQKVRRGGSHDQPASESRVSARKIRSIEGKDGSIGFRLALSVTDSRPAGMDDPCNIHQPPTTGGMKGFRDERLITAEGEIWVNENYGYPYVLIINENAAITGMMYNNNLFQPASGEWYTLNCYSLNIVSSTGTTSKYIYYMIDKDNMSMMPEGGMPGRWQRKSIQDIAGAENISVPVIAQPKDPEELAPVGYNIDMSNPPTNEQDPRLIEGADMAWLQDNVALGAGGTHRYRFDFDSENHARFVVWDPPSSTGLAQGTWFTVDNTFLRITKDGKNYDYLYTVSEDGKKFYHISFQGYEPGDFRLFDKVNASDVPDWIEPTMFPYETMDNGCSTYTPPAGE
jgi:formylglycine-generating enzyme required for sulfatase activity